jgi:integrase/recombinase XerD
MNCHDKQYKVRTHRGRPKGTSNPATALTDKQVSDLYNACYGARGHFLRAFISFGLFSGMRVGTIAGLSLNQVIDMKNKVRTKIVVQADQEKSKRTHIYFLAPQGQRIIQEYVDNLLRNNPDITREQSLFPGRKSKTFMTATIASRMVNNLMKKAEIEQNSSHALRKTFATNAYVKLGLGAYEIQKLLNHAQVSQSQKYINNLTHNIENALSNMKY